MIVNKIPDQQLLLQYNDLARAVREIVAEVLVLPDAAVKTQCKVIGKTTLTLEVKDIESLAPRLGKAVAMFTNPDKGAMVERQVARLRYSTKRPY